MSVEATIGVHTVGGDVVDIEIHPTLIGTWELTLKNIGNEWGDDFHANDDVELKINTVSMMKGYVDDVFPYLDKKGVYKNMIKVVGRNYARQIARETHSGGYVDVKADDLMDDVLDQTGCEVTFVSLSTAPVVTMERIRHYILDWLNEVRKRVNYEAFVDGSKVLHFFAAGDAGGHTDVDLTSITGSLDNNILDLKKGEEIGFSIYNFITLIAGVLNDHYTDANGAHWTPGANTYQPENDTTTKFMGLSSIKFGCTIAAFPSMHLDFSGGLYTYTALDFTEPNEAYYYWRWSGDSVETLTMRPVLEDGSGNVIEFKRIGVLIGVTQKGKTEALVKDKWFKLQYPIGDSEDNPIKDTETNNRWYYTTKIGAFDWTDVVKIRFLVSSSTFGEADIWVDGLSIPTVEVKAISQDASSIATYGKSMYPEDRPDVGSQVELKAEADDELEKRKDPLRKIRIIAIGQTGSKYIGQSLDVHAPGHGINSLTKYRILDLHHYIRHRQTVKGHAFITEYDLVKHDLSPTVQVIDPLRARLADDPTGTMLRILNRARKRTGRAQIKPRIILGDTHPPSDEPIQGDQIDEHTIDPINLKMPAQAYFCTVKFRPKVGDEHDSVEWDSGTLIFADGGTQGINAGSFDNLSPDQYYIYYTIGSGELSYDTDPANCVSDTKGIIAAVMVTTGTDEIQIFAIFSLGVNIITENLAAGSVTTEILVAESVTAEKIEAHTITAGQIQAGTITADEIAADAIDVEHIKAGVIRAIHIGAGEITADAILSENIYARHIKAKNITADHIEANTITADEIKAETITAGQLAADSVTTNKIVGEAVSISKLKADIHGKFVQVFHTIFGFEASKFLDTGDTSHIARAWGNNAVYTRELLNEPNVKYNPRKVLSEMKVSGSTGHQLTFCDVRVLWDAVGPDKTAILRGAGILVWLTLDKIAGIGGRDFVEDDADDYQRARPIPRKDDAGAGDGTSVQHNYMVDVDPSGSYSRWKAYVNNAGWNFTISDFSPYDGFLISLDNKYNQTVTIRVRICSATDESDCLYFDVELDYEEHYCANRLFADMTEVGTMDLTSVLRISFECLTDITATTGDLHIGFIALADEGYIPMEVAEKASYTESSHYLDILGAIDTTLELEFHLGGTVDDTGGSTTHYVQEPSSDVRGETLLDGEEP